MLNKGVKASLAEKAMSEAELYRSLSAGCSSHTEALLYGGGPSLTHSSGVPWTAAYIDSIGDPAADLRSTSPPKRAPKSSVTRSPLRGAKRCGDASCVTRNG